MILEVFSKTGLQQIFDFAVEQDASISDNAERILTLRDEYLNTIEDVIPFFQGKSQTSARQICSVSFLPQTSRFDQFNDMD